MSRPGPTAAPADPAALQVLLRQCVHCGLCLGTCATYLATGDETLSPRGRLLLLGEALAAAGTGDPGAWPRCLPPDTRRALELCLGCRACATACPSGVPFALFEAALAAAVRPDPPLLRLVRPERLPWLRRLGGAAESVLRRLLGTRWRERLARWPLGGARLARLLGSRPAAPDDRALAALLDRRTGLRTAAWNGPAPVPARRRAVLFRGCADAGLLPAAQARLVRLLRAAGFAVTAPADQVCCGALDAHGGRPAAAQRYRRRNLAALATACGDGAPLVVQAAGCGLELRHYPEPVGSAVSDAVALLADADLPPLRRVPLTVAIHDPCHARHGQSLVAAPRRLLGRLPGVTVVEPADPEVCCGSGGPYALLHPVFSAVMGRRKARELAALGADVVVTSNPGCLGQLRDALAREAPELPVILLTDLVWYAALPEAEEADGSGS